MYFPTERNLRWIFLENKELLCLPSLQIKTILRREEIEVKGFIFSGGTSVHQGGDARSIF